VDPELFLLDHVFLMDVITPPHDFLKIAQLYRSLRDATSEALSMKHDLNAKEA